MYCPQCHAEYRQGFTRCSDCDLDLVSTLEEANLVRTAEAPADTGRFDVLLWEGKDTDSYLSLLNSLNLFGVGRLGRVVHSPPRRNSSSDLENSIEPAEFGVWISEKDKPFAEWILNSEREDEAENKAFLETGTRSGPTEEEKADAAKQTGYLCPLCDARFLEARTECPNCGVPLKPAQGFTEFEGIATTLTCFNHPQFAEAFCEALQRAGIPFGNPHLTSDVTVLASDEQRAQRIFANLLTQWEFGEGLSDRWGEDPRKNYWPACATQNGWLPEDLTVEAWSGTNLYKLVGVGQSLREFQIAYSVQIQEPGRAKVLVHPEEEARARELVRQVEEEAQRA